MSSKRLPSQLNLFPTSNDLNLTLTLQVDGRYQLTGDILDGQMDLDILNVRRTDSGPYCCRVNVDGLFNDKKMIMNLRVVKGEISHEFGLNRTATKHFSREIRC